MLYIGIALLTYVLIIAFPTYFFTNDMLVLKSIELGLRVAYLVFIIIFSRLTKLNKSYTGQTKLSNLFLLLPVFFIAFINIFYLTVIRGVSIVINPFSQVFIGINFISLIITAVEEVYLFFFIVQKNLTLAHKLARIFVAAAVFAITHIFIMLYAGLGIINPLDLFDIMFKFGIGIILGVLFEYTNNIVVPMSFNIIYTLSNQMLYKVTISDPDTHWSYYLTISLFAVFGTAYLLIFYFLMLKKENR